MKRFFNTFFFTVFTILFFLTVYSFAASGLMAFNSIFFVLLLIWVGYMTKKSLENGVYIAVAELIVGSQGHNFYLMLGSFKLGIRVGIFAVILTIFALHLLKNNTLNKLYNFHLSRYYYLLLAAVIYGGILGVLNSNGFSNVFSDVNGYLFFAYIPFFLYALKEKQHVYKLLQVICAALSMQILHTYFLLYIFSHTLIPQMEVMYLWTRDHRIGEIVRAFPDSNFHRVFFQSHIYALYAFLIVLPLSYFKIGKASFSNILSLKNVNENQSIVHISILTLLTTIILLSFSRSFWVGGLAGGIIIALHFVIKNKTVFVNYIKAIVLSITFCALSLFIIAGIVNFPLPLQTNGINSVSVLNQRLNFTDEAAVSSRWNLLPVMIDSIKPNPIFGYGFGKALTYNSNDPRIRMHLNPEGIYTTFSFEWGYLDLLLKFGLIGTIIYAILVLKIIMFCKEVYILYNNNENIQYVIIGSFAALVCLLAIHMFTPYLNHPLGIGYIILFHTILHVLKNHHEVTDKNAFAL